MSRCIKCSDSGIMTNGELCDCTNGEDNDISNMPLILDIPEQYQSSIFNSSFLSSKLNPSYGNLMQGIISDVKTNFGVGMKNYLICAPINSGKTIFAYTIYRIIYEAGLSMPKILDLTEVKKLMMDVYNQDENGYSLLINSKLAIVKVPLDLPSKFAETMCTVLDLRLRKGGYTIFLYDGSKEDLQSQDKFDRLSGMIGDGSYHTMKCYSYTVSQVK